MQEIHYSPAQKAKSQAVHQKTDEQGQATTVTEQLYAKDKPQRTLGMRLFDIGLYPLLSNFAVFAVSVLFTFLTARGGDKNAEGKFIYGKVGEWFQWRGNQLESGLRKTFKMDAKTAEMTKVVAFSYIDGSIMTVPVKFLENHRSKIAMSIDKTFGTTPDDMTVYDAEPKQTWRSIGLARTGTAAAVISTAILMNKKVAYRAIRDEEKVFEGLSDKPYATVFGADHLPKNTSMNDVFFNDLSERHSQKLPGFKRAFGRFLEKVTGTAPHATIQVPNIKNGVNITESANHLDKAYTTLARMTYFEFFYTSFCTAGLYTISRILAPFFDIKKSFDKKTEKSDGPKAHEAVATGAAEAKPVVTPTTIAIPRDPKVPEGRIHAQAAEMGRITEHEHALHA